MFTLLWEAAMDKGVYTMGRVRHSGLTSAGKTSLARDYCRFLHHQYAPDSDIVEDKIRVG